MSKKLTIQLSQEATEKYLAYASKRVEAEVNADCEPSGVSIQLEIGPAHYGSIAYLKTGNEYIELGEAEVEIIEVK
jgi:hypothetical protein